MIGNVLRIRYELTQLLSENPIFKAFAASDKVQGREVCVRIVNEPFAHETEFIEKLTEVITSLRSINHPGIEQLYEVDGDEEAVFMVGALTKGSSLSERLKKLSTFSVPASVETGIAISDALQSLHRSGLAHGDVGGHTVAMEPDGELRLQVPGIWRAYSASATAGSSMLPLMAPYMAPEISKGALPTPQSDVYSVGVVLFELLTGRKPFHADTPIAIALKHATDPVPSPKHINPSIPQVLDSIVKKAMAKLPSERYQDAGDLLSDLRILQDALRFGKSLSWPIQGPQSTEKAVPVAEPVPMTKAEEPLAQPVPKKPVRPEEPPGDVPLWIRYSIAFFSGLVAVMIIIAVIWNMKQPSNVSGGVPNLKGKTVAQATDLLKRIGLDLSAGTRETSESVPFDSIISQEPQPGSQIREGSWVRVTISNGSKFVEVPDVRGVTIDKAREILAAAGLELDDRPEQRSDRTVEAGMIISQVPKQREKHERLTKVHVTVSTGKARATTDENADTKYVYSIKIHLTDIDQPVTLRVDMTDNRGTKTLREEKHVPDDEVDISAEGYGSQVTFRIFYNGELVKEVPKNANGDESDTPPATDTTAGAQ